MVKAIYTDMETCFYTQVASVVLLLLSGLSSLIHISQEAYVCKAAKYVCRQLALDDESKAVSQEKCSIRIEIVEPEKDKEDSKKPQRDSRNSKGTMDYKSSES